MNCQCEPTAPCGCCEGPRILTPRDTANRPGLRALAVRVGTHANFFETMKARLASQDFPALRDLTTRASDDPAIAVLDAWATAADVLTFYTERIANEGYLRTALERRSVLELARLTGYRPRPGVAASVFLAFALDTGAALEIPAGQPARSIPAPGTTDLPQTFETSHPLKARAELNRLRPRMSLPQEITPENVFNLSEIYLQGSGLNLKANDVLVFSFASDPASLALRRVETATPDHENKRTVVAFKLELLSVPFFLQKMRTGLAALKKSAGFDVGAGKLERQLVTDANAFADQLAPKLAGNQNLTNLDAAVVATTTEEKGSETKVSYELVGEAIEFLAKAADDLLSKSTAAVRTATQGRDKLLDDFRTRAEKFGESLTLVQSVLVLNTVPPAPLTTEQITTATTQVNDALNALDNEVLAAPLTTLRTALKVEPFVLTNFTNAANALAPFLPTAPASTTTKTDLAKVLDAIAGEKGPGLSLIVKLVFEPSPTTPPGLSIVKLRNEANGATPARAEFASVLQKLLDKLTADFALFLKSTATLKDLNADFDRNSASAAVKPLTDVQRIYTPRTNFSKALGKINPTTPPVPALTEIAFAKLFDTNFAALAQPPAFDSTAKPTGDPEFFLSFISLGSAVGTLRENLRDLRTAFIARGQAIIQRYAFLRTGGGDAQAVFTSLDNLRLALAAAGNHLDDAAVAGIGALVKKIGPNAGATAPSIPATPLEVLNEKLRAPNPLRQTFLRLQADLRGLIGQVNVAPAPSRNEALDVSALGGGLDTLGGQLDSLRPAPIGNPLGVERKLDETFQAGNRQASDMIARTVARLGGVSAEEFFAVWGEFRSGEVDARVCVLRQKTGVFGNNSPRGEDIGTANDIKLNARFLKPDGETDWSVRAEDLRAKIALENEFPQVSVGGFVAVQRADQQTQDAVPYRIKSVHSGPRSVYGITGKSTEVELEGVSEWGKDYQAPPISAPLPTRVEEPLSALDSVLESNRNNLRSQEIRFVPTNPPTRLPLFDLIRRTVVHVGSEALALAEAPVTREIGLDAASGADGAADVIGEDRSTIMLDGLRQGLEPGRWLVVSGERTDGASGARVSEPVLIARVEHVLLTSAREKDSAEKNAQPLPRAGDTPHTRIVLSKKLNFSYKRETVEIFGNVVDATHGETRAEVLGNGDARVEFQRFEIKQPPVTFTAAPTAAGAESSLAVRVNDVLWHEAESFAALGAADRRFVTETDDDGKARVIFGNGREGARLPTGSENVRARYRNGIGKPGNVKAGAISQLTSKPLGLKDVINPLRSSGGADRDSREQMRRNAPLATLALERLVSLRDYQDFAQTFAGIGKASATRLSDGGGRFVHVTIAGLDDIPIDTTSDLFANFTASLGRAGDPHLRVCVQPRELVLLVLVAKVRVQADYLWEKVEPKLRAALLEAFGFERRALGQSAAASEVLGVMQAIEGVDYVDVDSFGGIPEKRTDGSGGRAPLSPQDIANRVSAMKSAPRVPAALAGYEPPPAGVPGTDSLRPAQLAIFSPDVRDTLILKEIKP